MVIALRLHLRNLSLSLALILSQSLPTTADPPKAGDLPPSQAIVQSPPPPMKLTPAIFKRLMQILPDAVHKATEIQFYSCSPEGDWKYVPLATASERSHPHMFHLMKRTIFTQSPVPGSRADIYIDFVADGKTIDHVAYYPNNGWLVQFGKQRGTVPDELQKWIVGLETALFPFRGE